MKSFPPPSFLAGLEYGTLNMFFTPVHLFRGVHPGHPGAGDQPGVRTLGPRQAPWLQQQQQGRPGEPGHFTSKEFINTFIIKIIEYTHQKYIFLK